MMEFTLGRIINIHKFIQVNKIKFSFFLLLHRVRMPILHLITNFDFQNSVGNTLQMTLENMPSFATFPTPSELVFFEKKWKLVSFSNESEIQKSVLAKDATSSWQRPHEIWSS